MLLQIEIRSDIAAEWTSNNPILLNGEIGLETDTTVNTSTSKLYKGKIGNGTTAWNSLPYFSISHPITISDVGGLSAALGNKADLVGGVIPVAQIPAIAISEFLGEVADSSVMTSLSGQRGDWCIRSDEGITYILASEDPTDKDNWIAITFPSHSHEITDIVGLSEALSAIKMTDGSFYLVICPASTTRFLPLFAGYTGLQSNQALVLMSVNERQRISNFRLTTNTVQSFTGSQVITVQKNGVDTAAVITIPPSAVAGVFTSSESVEFQVGDTVNLKVVNNGNVVAAQLGGLTYTRVLL